MSSGSCCSKNEETHYYSHAKLFWVVFGILMVLTVITVAASQVDFGVLNFVIAMLIASVKALLVALIFMHLKWEDSITWLYAIFPIALLLLMLGLLFLDTPFRTDPKDPFTSGASVGTSSPRVVEHH